MIFIEAPPALQLYWILLASWNQSSLNKSFRSLPSYRRKPLSRLFEIPGFRVGPRLSPELPGMTTEFCCEFWDRTQCWYLECAYLNPPFFRRGNFLRCYFN